MEDAIQLHENNRHKFTFFDPDFLKEAHHVQVSPAAEGKELWELMTASGISYESREFASHGAPEEAMREMRPLPQTSTKKTKGSVSFAAPVGL
jgi:hypothetical protein